jgi:hypothetical protein
MNRGAWYMVLAVLITACGEGATGPGSGPQPAVLQISGWDGTLPTSLEGIRQELRWSRPPLPADIVPPRVLEIPDTVSAGVAFEAVTYTVAPNGCWRAAGQRVTHSASARLLILEPYDERSHAQACTLALVFPEHRSRVVLHERGEWTVRVLGLRILGGGASGSEPVMAEKTIVVR